MEQDASSKQDKVLIIQGVRYLSPSQAAQIWNERAQQAGMVSRYTRHSVYQRKNDPVLTQEGAYVDTPNGRYYREEVLHKVSLRPREVTREDVRQRGIARKREKQPEQPKEPDEGAGCSSSVICAATSLVGRLVGV